MDWQHVYDRLEETRRTLEEGEALSSSAERRILEERAQRLAQPLAESAEPGDAFDVLAFSRAGAAYAVAAAAVEEIVPLGEPTPVPRVPPAVVGVVNHRGRIVPVVDVAPLLAGAPSEPTETSFAVVVVAAAARFALKADAVSGIVRVEERHVLPADELADRGDSVVRALTPDMTAILDLEALARDPRVEVNDEVE